MYFRMSAVLIFALLLLATPAVGETWTSPDGVLSVTPPDATKFQVIPNPPVPLIALWVSNDEQMRFGVVKAEVPPGIKLNQSSTEQGLAKELGGQVTRLPTKTLAGHDVWLMTGKGPSMEMTQAICRHGGTVYKVMAATVGGDSDTEMVNQFVGSIALTPLEAAGRSETIGREENASKPARGLDSHEVSKKLGAAGVLILVAVYFATRGTKKRQS